jgi:hypothetical protein
VSASPFAPFSSAPAADPFEGAEFGFEVPQGDPGAIRTAGARATTLAMTLSFRAQDVTRAASEATAGWSGQAQGEFADLASRTAGGLGTNSDAFTRAGTAMTTLADQLEQAQQVTRQAAQQCATYQRAMSTAQTEATTQPRGRGDAAARGGASAGRELQLWQKRGQTAATTYAQQAQHAAGEVAGAAGQLRPLRGADGAPPPPIPVGPGDVKIAQSVFDRVKDLPASAFAKNPGKAIDQAAGRHLTPAQLAVLYEMASDEHDAGKGSLIDGVGGFVNFATGGLVHFGNPKTGRYRGGEIAGMLPIDPEALITDAERGALKLTDKEAEHLAEEDGAREFAKDPSGTRYGPMNEGPLEKDVATTFRSSSYTKVVTDKPQTLYRVYPADGNPVGGYWTRVKPAGPLQSRLDSALNPAWGNTAEKVSKITVPPGTTFYEGAAGEQTLGDGGKMIGGGNQIFIPGVDKRWLTP